MKKVVRYLLEGDGTITKFVESGGYFPIGQEMVGVSVDESTRHVPATVVRMTKLELIARVASTSPTHPLTNEQLTNEQIENIVNSWLQENNLEGYE